MSKSQTFQDKDYVHIRLTTNKKHFSSVSPSQQLHVQS